MRKPLERIRLALKEAAETHQPLAAVIQQLLLVFDDALQPPLSKQIDFIHRGQRLLKIAATKAYEKPELLKKVLTSSDPSWSMMRPPEVDRELVEALGKQLFQSSGAKAGEKIIIATTEDGRDVAECVIVECLRADVDFELGIKDPERMMMLINGLNEEALQSLSDLNLKKYEGCHREIIISSGTSPEIKAQIDAEQMRLYKAMNQEIHDRAMSGDLHYTLTRIPNRHDAELDGMDYDQYLELFFQLCDQPWKQIEVAQQQLIDRFDAGRNLHITNADGTDIHLDITDQTFANSVIAKNIPGSEIFSSPLREGVNGTIVAKGKFRYGGSGLMENIRLQFENGRLESWSAESGQEDLEKIVTMDDSHGEGTRHLGEIGIGTNPHLRKHVINSLLVEKIGGSFHVALGSCYTYNEYLGTPVRLKNGNRSHAGVHWDLTTMLRGREGKMYLDGELVQDNGDWVGKEYDVLNQGWGALSEDLQPQWWREQFRNGYQ